MAGEYNYEKIVGEAMGKMASNMNWPVDWFREDLPLENKDNSSLDSHIADAMNSQIQCPNMLLNFVKPAKVAPLEFPIEKPKQERILVFSDNVGYMKGVLENAPEGRIAFKNVIEDPWSMTYEDLLPLFDRKKPWDMVIFASGMNSPQSDSIPDVIDMNSKITHLYLDLLRAIQKKEESVKRLACVTRGIFEEDPKKHKKYGLKVTVGACLFGMCNSARQELESPTALQYLDCAWLHKNSKELFAKIASELFRKETFGHCTVRINLKGRYVMRCVNVEDYMGANKEWVMPTSGIIAIGGGNGALGLVMGKWLLDKAEEQNATGFSIQFLSRSMKISDLNMVLWKDLQAKADSLGIKVEQQKCDMSTQAALDQYLESVTPNLVGFIHSAGVLQDSMLFNLTWEKCETVFDSKHRLALLLHDGFARYQNPLKFFWMFSSVAVYGNMGQINYSGSNAFLDCLARYRDGCGLPCTVMQWGAWGDVGMAATMDDAMRRRTMNSPMPYFSVAEGLAGMEAGLKTGMPYWSVFKMNPNMMVGMIQPPEPTMMAYTRNFYSEVMPTPLAPNLDKKHLYTVLRMMKGDSYSTAPDCERLCFEQYSKPLIEAQEKEWGDDSLW